MPPNKKNKKKQARLDFTPVPSSSPQRPEAHMRLNYPLTSYKRQKIRNDSDLDSFHRQLSPDIAKAIALSKHDPLLALLQSPGNEVDQLPTPEPSSQLEPPGNSGERRLRERTANIGKSIRSAASRSSPDFLHNQISSDSDEVTSARTLRRRRPNANPTALSSSSEEEKVARPKSSRPPSVRSFLVGGSSGTAPIPRARGNVKRLSLSKRAVNIVDSSSSEEETTNTTAARERRNSSLKIMQRRNEENRKSHEDENESDAILTTLSQIGPSKTQLEESSEEDEDDSEVILTTPSRRHRTSRRSEELNEDGEDSMLEELGEAESEESRKRQTRQGQGNSVRAKRLQNLLKLKERRAGVVQDLEDNEDEQKEEEQYEDEIEEIEVDHEQSTDEDRASKDLDDYESDFVEDDGEIGVDLMKHGVPLELTGQANKKPFGYFRDEVEWMVHNKLDPAFERNDEIYEMAHKKLNDEVIGLAGSEFKSSVWRENFTKALQTRPEFFTTAIGLESMEFKCQACNRSKHIPKWLITFSGPLYDKKSLERFSSKDVNESHLDSDDESDEAEEKEEKWYVGSVCCGNAEIAHTLYHWRYQLNATILQWLAENNHTTPAKVVEREGWSRKKKERFANKIVDGMLESGEMKSLYKEFKQNIDAAFAARTEKAQR